jgi:hypothetical protein
MMLINDGVCSAGINDGTTSNMATADEVPVTATVWQQYHSMY